MNVFRKILSFIFLLCALTSCKESISQSTDDKDCISKYDSTLERRIYTFVDEMPQYFGGPAKLDEFLHKNIKYPIQQAEEGLQGRTYLTFIVEPNGTLSNIDVLKKHNGTISPLDEEVIRVLRLMPPWTAGKCNGKPVAVRMNLPIYIHVK